MRATRAAVSSSFRRYCAIWSSWSAIDYVVSPGAQESDCLLFVFQVCAAAEPLQQNPLCLLMAVDSSISFRSGRCGIPYGQFADHGQWPSNYMPAGNAERQAVYNAEGVR